MKKIILTEDFEFQSVVVVPASFDARNGLEGLRNAGLCHPGFNDSQSWSDGVLKYFENRAQPDHPCRGWNRTAVENGIENLKDFFGKGCRPGEWVADEDEDRKLSKLNRRYQFFFIFSQETSKNDKFFRFFSREKSRKVIFCICCQEKSKKFRFFSKKNRKKPVFWFFFKKNRQNHFFRFFSRKIEISSFFSQEKCKKYRDWYV